MRFRSNIIDREEERRWESVCAYFFSSGGCALPLIVADSFGFLRTLLSSSLLTRHACATRNYAQNDCIVASENVHCTRIRRRFRSRERLHLLYSKKMKLGPLTGQRPSSTDSLAKFTPYLTQSILTKKGYSDTIRDLHTSTRNDADNRKRVILVAS